MIVLVFILVSIDPLEKRRFELFYQLQTTLLIRRTTQENEVNDEFIIKHEMVAHLF